MLNHRATAQFLAAALIAAAMSISTAPPAAADDLDLCELIKKAKAENGNVGGESSYTCPKSTGGDENSGTSHKSGSNHRPQGVNSKGESCDPRKDTDCDSLMISIKTVTTSDVQEVATQLKLPNPTPRFGPDPSANEWKMLAVGYPIWLWTDRPTTISTTAHHDGLTFTLVATWTSTTFTMGDGHSKTCTATTIRPKTVKPATKPSPTCSYTYQTKSKIGHPYTVTANTHWRINWTTNGYQGTFTHTYTGNRTLNIGELQSLING
jgi:hypothetical protein